MRIVFSDHAQQQMQERNLTKAPIRAIIQHPQVLIQQSRARFRAVGLLPQSQKRYVLVVVYDVISGGRMEVVTAFVTSKIKKYL